MIMKVNQIALLELKGFVLGIHFKHIHCSKLGIAFANQSLSSTSVLSFPHFKPNIVLDVHTTHKVGKLQKVSTYNARFHTLEVCYGLTGHTTCFYERLLTSCTIIPNNPVFPHFRNETQRQK